MRLVERTPRFQCRARPCIGYHLSRSPEVARALLRALDREDDLKTQLMLREILGTTISTTLRPQYWELERWRELVKQNTEDPNLWPEPSAPEGK